MYHRREFSWPCHLPALGPLPVCVGHVPVPSFGQNKALCGLQTKRIDVDDSGQECSKMLSACRNAELGTLLDRVIGVATGIRQADDLGFGLLGLQ